MKLLHNFQAVTKNELRLKSAATVTFATFVSHDLKGEDCISGRAQLGQSTGKTS